jgi:hypothetical protein
LPVPASGILDFQILRSGAPVGEQRLTFTQTGDQLSVDINAAASGKMMGLLPFHYNCTATERWAGGVFCGVDSKVNHNGTQLEVHATPITGGFAITSTKAGNYKYTGQLPMLPLTYWNKAMLDAMILNIETGRNYPAIVSSPGWYNLPTAEGGTVLAQRFDVTGKLHFSVWYDRYGQWAGLEFTIYGNDMTLRKFVS